MTEDEAKTKWCPFAQTPNYLGTTLGSTNRNIHGDGLNTSLCLGSDCMAWRGADIDKPYCGLAGKP